MMLTFSGLAEAGVKFKGGQILIDKYQKLDLKILQDNLSNIVIKNNE